MNYNWSSCRKIFIQIIQYYNYVIFVRCRYQIKYFNIVEWYTVNDLTVHLTIIFVYYYICILFFTIKLQSYVFILLKCLIINIFFVGRFKNISQSFN